MSKGQLFRPFRGFAIFMAITVTLTGCIVQTVEKIFPPPSLPIQVYIQDTWQEQGEYGNERADIEACLLQWNQAVAFRVLPGKPWPFQLAGYITIAEFTPPDLIDQKSVVYRLPILSDEIGEMATAAGKDLETTLGYGLGGGDGLIFIGKINERILNFKTDLETGFGTKISPSYLQQVAGESRRSTICHEMGHMLGLSHNPAGGIMDENRIWPAIGESFVREIDADAFCILHQAFCD